MKRIAILIVAAFAVISGSTVAQAINNEAVCGQPGYTMDPRCVGQ